MTQVRRDRQVRHIQPMLRMSRTPEYRAWGSMIQRCTNPRATHYKNYGGRGIKICKRWLRSYKNFLYDMGPQPYGWTLERINNNKGYCPSNCRWATMKEQGNNRRNSIRVLYKGRLITTMQLSKITGINYNTIRDRKSRGWSDSQLSYKGDKRFNAKRK